VPQQAGININIPAKGAENDSDDEGQEKDPAAAYVVERRLLAACVRSSTTDVRRASCVVYVFVCWREKQHRTDDRARADESTQQRCDLHCPDDSWLLVVVSAQHSSTVWIERWHLTHLEHRWYK